MRLIGPALAAGVLAAGMAEAAVVYTDGFLFLREVGPNRFEDFGSFTEDTEFRTQAVTVGNLTIRGEPGVNGDETNLIDAPPIRNPQADIDGAYLLGDLSGSQEIRIDFARPVSAFGALFRGIANEPRTTDLRFYGSDGGLLGVITPGTEYSYPVEFWGIDLEGDAASWLIIGNADPLPFNDIFGVDDIYYRLAPIPLPASGALVLAALGALGLCRLRRR